MEGWVIVAVVAVGLPMLLGLVAIVLEHWQKMAAVRTKTEAARQDLDHLSGEYQEFVLGVDARLRKMEERLRLVEARQRQSGGSDDTQQVRRG